MKYAAIIGLNYKDCKAMEKSIKPSGESVRYAFITKAKHVQGIPFSEVITTENAKENVNYQEIMDLLSGKPKVEPKKEETTVDKNQLKIDFEVKPEPEVDELPPVPEEDDESNDIEEEIQEPMLEEIEKYDELEEEVLEDDELEEEVEEEIIDEDETPEPEVDNGNEYIPEEEEVIITESEEDDGTLPPDDEDESEEEDIKPAGDPPRGWHARKEYIDEAGNVFNKGKFVGNINDGE